MSEPPTRVAVIGPGRVGTSLARALPGEYRLVAVAGRGAEALARFAEQVGRVPVRSAAEAAGAADLVLLTVGDDALDALVAELAVADVAKPGSRWLHTAGSRGVEALRPLRLAGARVAACHPAVSFPDSATGASRLPGAAWGVTAPPGEAGWAVELVADLGGVAFLVAEEARTRYHLAMALASNATVAVTALARDLLLGAGVTDPAALLRPIASTSVAGAAERGAAALTGPVRRGDAGTVAAHVRELAVALPEASAVYAELSALALGYARRAGLDAEAAEAVAQVLDDARGAAHGG